MSADSTMLQPMCLVENVNGKLSVNKEATAFLKKIKQRVVVVSVVGLYRTGKSYLMNRLAGQQSGFPLGNTVESKTKGIWMWCVHHPTMTGHTLVLLDTEGLGDVNKGDSKNDGWIFCLAVLLSSTLVYNSQGTIQNNAVEQLHYVTELADRIKVNSNEDTEATDSKFVCFFPSFVWAVRDFLLDLEIAGKKVTADKYLDFALELKTGRGKAVSDYNLPRECIRAYFPSRKCFVFPFPTSPGNMKKLEQLQEHDLDKAFLDMSVNFCEHVYAKSAVKTLRGGQQVTGKMLGHLVDIYVETISSGKVPCLDNAVEVLAKLENQAAVEEALKVYQNGMEQVKKKFPVSNDQMIQEHKKFCSLATSEFMKRSFKDQDDVHLKKLEEAIHNHYAELLKKNKTASEKKCRDLLKQLFSDMSARLEHGHYSQPGGYEVYCKDRDAVVQQYRKNKNKGVAATSVLNEFLNDRLTEANTILYNDIKLSEYDRKIQEEKEKTHLMEEKNKEEKEKRIQYEQQIQAERERHEDQMSQLEEKFHRDLQQQKEELDRAMEQKLKEMDDLKNQGFAEKAALLEKEIQQLKEEKADKEKQTIGQVIGKGVDFVVDETSNLLKKLKFW